MGNSLLEESSVWQEAVAIGETKGEIRGERASCLKLLAAFHPDLVARLRPAIELCTDTERLEAWLVQIPRLSPEALLHLITQAA